MPGLFDQVKTEIKYITTDKRIFKKHIHALLWQAVINLGKCKEVDSDLYDFIYQNLLREFGHDEYL